MGDSGQETSQLSHAQEAQEWQGKIKRLVRRSKIDSGLRDDLGLDEIKEKVRREEKEMGLDEVLRQMVEEEVVVDPEYRRVVEQLLPEIQKVDPRVVAIVMMGSGIHGGARLKGGVSDLDWGVVIDESVRKPWWSRWRGGSDQDEVDWKVAADAALEKITGPNGIRSCGMINPDRYKAVHLPSEEKIEGWLGLLREGEDYIRQGMVSEDILTYFEPSVPAEVNEKNRELVMAVLDRLRERNPHLWEQVVGKIESYWRKNHVLKAKHIKRARRKKDRDMAWEVELDSGGVMSMPFERSLEREERR